MRFEVKVCDSIHNIMFIAQVDDIYVSAFAPLVKPFTSSIKEVEIGAGNCGNANEYLATYSGNCIKYPDFVKLMNNIDI